MNMVTNEIELMHKVVIDFHAIDTPMYVKHSEVQKNEFYLLQSVRKHLG